MPGKIYQVGDGWPALQRERFFRFGNEGLYYGELASDTPSPTPNGNLCDVMSHTASKSRITYLPFDVAKVADNLRFELYSKSTCLGGSFLGSRLAEIYYLVRPLLPVAVRKNLQKARLSDWNTLKFPR